MEHCVYCKKIRWPWQRRGSLLEIWGVSHKLCGKAAMKERLRRVYIETGQEAQLKKPFLTELD